MVKGSVNLVTVENNKHRKTLKFGRAKRFEGAIKREACTKKSQDYSVLSLTPSLVALAFFGLKGYDREMEELYGLRRGKEEIGDWFLKETVAAQERMEMDPKRRQKGTCEGETRQKQTGKRKRQRKVRTRLAWQTSDVMREKQKERRIRKSISRSGREEKPSSSGCLAGPVRWIRTSTRYLLPESVVPEFTSEK
ncbi:hypothetical protein BDV23DRAFT_91316 [Aspergillus alliaceus]|uniref:Uncharacterized protein n=1 Tax=Petromyces alliaceus TaxID=209559 RepID=A0A5N6FMZ6_PETAA|nr:uncharacterized protein BDW43DRAFT_160066 [Aspergillus alliaceus]KAB8230565.1 hypothetical protein BDW43DRAFT_160066 [Aspergillus alliaceus]KAE8390045.1 hypothetical protein BDV23DRAFT_91316 [Aspergillus alliaceus]